MRQFQFLSVSFFYLCPPRRLYAYSSRGFCLSYCLLSLLFLAVSICLCLPVFIDTACIFFVSVLRPPPSPSPYMYMYVWHVCLSRCMSVSACSQSMCLRLAQSLPVSVPINLISTSVYIYLCLSICLFLLSFVPPVSSCGRLSMSVCVRLCCLYMFCLDPCLILFLSDTVDWITTIWILKQELMFFLTVSDLVVSKEEKQNPSQSNLFLAFSRC